MPHQSIVTELNSLWVQVVTGHSISGFGHANQQPPRAAGRFKQSFDLSSGMFLKAGGQEILLGFTIGPKQQVVVLGVIINAGRNVVRHESIIC